MIWSGRTKIPSIHRRDFGPGDQNHCVRVALRLGSRLCFCAGTYSTVYPVSGLVWPVYYVFNVRNQQLDLIYYYHNNKYEGKITYYNNIMTVLIEEVHN